MAKGKKVMFAFILETLDGGAAGSFWTPPKKCCHRSSVPKKPEVTPATKVLAPQDSAGPVEDEMMAEVEPSAPANLTPPPAPIPVPSSNSPPSMESLLAHSPFPHKYDCMAIVSWMFKVNKSEYEFERATLEQMLEEADHTIPQCISNILTLIREQSVPTWA